MVYFPEDHLGFPKISINHLRELLWISLSYRLLELITGLYLPRPIPRVNFIIV